MFKFMSVLVMALFFSVVSGTLAAAEDAVAKPSLVERLGFPKDAKLLIVNGDDFGMNHATNEGTIKAIKSGGMTSTTVMTPCPWFLEAAKFAKDNKGRASVGVHTTLTSEWGEYKWGPVVGWQGAPSICDTYGYFWDDVVLVYGSSKIAEVEKEVRAQIDRAKAAGIDVTHIDSHMGTMQYNPEYHVLYINIAKSYNLPARIAGHDIMDKFGGGSLIDMADEMGVLHPDVLYMDDPPTIEETESWWKKRISGVEPGKVTELYIHCGTESPEMYATTGSAKRRIADTNFFSDPKTVQWMKDQKIELISYRELRTLQQTGKPMPRAKYGWD